MTIVRRLIEKQWKLCGEWDQLRMAFPCAPFRQRPKEFTTKKELEPRYQVFTYKRVKP